MLFPTMLGGISCFPDEIFISRTASRSTAQEDLVLQYVLPPFEHTQVSKPMGDSVLPELRCPVEGLPGGVQMEEYHNTDMSEQRPDADKAVVYHWLNDEISGCVMHRWKLQRRSIQPTFFPALD